MLRLLLLAFAVAAFLAACNGDDQKPSPKTTASRSAAATAVAIDSALRLESEAFEEGQPIPPLYTCEGDNVSPPLSWGGPSGPGGAQSFTLIMDDPDAPGGTFTHWLLYDLPTIPHTLAQGVVTGEQPPTGGIQGRNDGNRVGYTGPCPPEGQTHRYVFTLYALDAMLDLEPGASADEVHAAIEGHVLAEAALTGTFGR